MKDYLPLCYAACITLKSISKKEWCVHSILNHEYTMALISDEKLWFDNLLPILQNKNQVYIYYLHWQYYVNVMHADPWNGSRKSQKV